MSHLDCYFAINDCCIDVSDSLVYCDLQMQPSTLLFMKCKRGSCFVYDCNEYCWLELGGKSRLTLWA